MARGPPDEAKLSLDPTQLGILTVAALLTSILSAIIGMAGGITLLAVMLLFYDPLVAIPIHGVVQLVSNGSRTWLQRRNVDRGILLRYAALLAPGGVLGIALLREAPPDLIRALIGVFVLMATWARQWLLLGTHPERTDRNRRFLALGAVVGVLNTTIGATGPLIAPFFLEIGLTRQALVGTKAACQAVAHVVKIVLFGLVGFAFAPWLAPLAVLCTAVIAGTWLGTQILDRVSERLFVILYRVVLTAIALRLVIHDGGAWLGLN